MIQPDCFKQQVRHETYLSLPFADNPHKISLGNESDAKRFDRKAPTAHPMSALLCGYPIQRGHGLRAKQHDCKSLFAPSLFGAVLRPLNPLAFPDCFRQSLLSHFHGGSIAGAGLDTRYSWRARHPQADCYKGQFSIPIFRLDGINPSGLSCFGGMGREPKKQPPAAPLSFVALSCGYPIRLCIELQRILPMIYSFLIAPQSLPVSELNRIRIVSCYAKSLKQARTSFSGLSVALLSRRPAGGQQHV